MRADLGFPLALAEIQSIPATVLLNGIKAWLARDDPVSLMHPHGFFVVRLNRMETEEWRFHLWAKGTRPIVGMPAYIHTHDCHVESRVLQGELTNILYDVSQVSTGGRPLYTVGYSGDRYTASTSNFLHRSEARVEARVQLRETIVQGGAYRIERHTYHEAVAPEHVTTATLVCMHSRSPGPVGIVGLDGYPETIGFVRSEHRAREFIDLISI